LLGLLYYGGLSKTVQDIRLLGVLQRIALCYFFSGIAFIFLRNPRPNLRTEATPRPAFIFTEWFISSRWLVLVMVVLLVSYWALMTFVPVPEVGREFIPKVKI
jgi:predicted acyltransferase